MALILSTGVIVQARWQYQGRQLNDDLEVDNYVFYLKFALAQPLGSPPLFKLSFSDWLLLSNKRFKQQQLFLRYLLSATVESRYF